MCKFNGRKTTPPPAKFVSINYNLRRYDFRHYALLTGGDDNVW